MKGGVHRFLVHAHAATARLAIDDVAGKAGEILNPAGRDDAARLAHAA
jgi:hypothetical protein